MSDPNVKPPGQLTRHIRVVKKGRLVGGDKKFMIDRISHSASAWAYDQATNTLLIPAGKGIVRIDVSDEELH